MERRHACLGAEDGARRLKGKALALLALLAWAVGPAPAWAAPFTFLVYGDSRADKDCKGNAIHARLVRSMVSTPHAFVVHTGDMITGFAQTTNFAKRGTCQQPDSSGSYKEIISPLTRRMPPPGLMTTYYPVIGNHDDGWAAKWYPDALGDGICDVFFMRGLVPNHTKMHYYAGGRRSRLSDAEFQRLLCSKTDSRVYPGMVYYSFAYQDAHFIVLRINNNNFGLESCQRCSDTKDYHDYYNIHQLHWLLDDLEAARSNRTIRNIFVFLHSPVFGSGDRHPNTPSWKRLAGIFTQYRVKAVFSGHSHLYERSVPIVVDGSAPEGTRNESRGTLYVTTGGGGAELHGMKAKPWYSEVRHSVFHHVEVRVDGDRMHLRALDIDGKLIDEVRR